MNFIEKAFEEGRASAKARLSKEFSKLELHPITYSDVVRELLSQIDSGCDLIPIDSSFTYEDLTDWISKHYSSGNQVLIIKDSLNTTTGKVLSVVFAQDGVPLTAEDKDKACFVYLKLNKTIEDVFPNGKRIYVKPL